MTHDYKRHGTTTLFAALDVLEGTATLGEQRPGRSLEIIPATDAPFRSGTDFVYLEPTIWLKRRRDMKCVRSLVIVALQISDQDDKPITRWKRLVA